MIKNLNRTLSQENKIILAAFASAKVLSYYENFRPYDSTIRKAIEFSLASTSDCSQSSKNKCKDMGFACAQIGFSLLGVNEDAAKAALSASALAHFAANREDDAFVGSIQHSCSVDNGFAESEIISYAATLVLLK